MRVTWIVSAATAFVLLGASIVVFLNPVWVGFEQARAGVPEHLGTSARDCGFLDVGAATGWILHDLVVGGDFDVQAPGTTRCLRPLTGQSQTVLTDAEQSHMRDVRGVFQGLYVLVGLSIVALSLTFRRAKAPAARVAWLGAVRRGAVGLTVVVAVLGAISLVAFDAAFEAFHRLFFAPGSYDFNPATSRLIQLFPDQFWSDTTLALGVVVIVASALVAWLATRRLSGLEAGRGNAGTAATLRVGEAAR